MTHNFDDLFARTPVMAILRGYSVERTLELANTAWDLGIDCVEVPIQSASAIEALKATVKSGLARSKFVGAGTVTSPELVQQARDAGATFTVSPGLDTQVVAASLEVGMPSLPGVASASEIQQAMRLGLDWVKAFPAAELGESWFTAMHGPFPQMKFVATGGIDVRNAGRFLTAGARVISLGSALSDPAALTGITELLRGSGPVTR